MEWDEQTIDNAAKAAFNVHWPRDKWERFKEGDVVKELYRAIAIAVLNSAKIDPDLHTKE